MPSTVTLSVKIPRPLKRRLAADAKKNIRSITSQLVTILNGYYSDGLSFIGSSPTKPGDGPAVTIDGTLSNGEVESIDNDYVWDVASPVPETNSPNTPPSQ